ncbi:MAG TPA: hypothetical protein DDX40_05410 [Rikenellaceae bacterium]|nr:hypothetical protein [Rikenellaceae bacterium]
MSKIIYAVLPIIIFFVFPSCGRSGTGDESEYYVKYMAEAVSETVAVEEHPIIVAVPAVYKVQGNSTTCYCKQSFEKEYGPFFSGEKVSIMVADSPEEHTYTMSIYVKQGRDGVYNLVSQGKYGTSYVIP